MKVNVVLAQMWITRLASRYGQEIHVYYES